MSPAAMSNIQSVSGAIVTYTTDPGAARSGGVYSGRATPTSAIIINGEEPPYAYPNVAAKSSLPPPPGAGTDRAADYYQRRYGAPMERSASQDSVV